MTQAELTEIIADEIADDRSRTNLHGIDLERCLVPPIQHDYVNIVEEGGTVPLWLVLEEWPDTKSGYKIVFDQETKLFGLAVAGRGKDVLIGYYGSFLETLHGM